MSCCKLSIQEQVEAERWLADHLPEGEKGERIWVAVRDHEVVDQDRILRRLLDRQDELPPHKRGYIFPPLSLPFF